MCLHNEVEIVSPIPLRNHAANTHNIDEACECSKVVTVNAWDETKWRNKFESHHVSAWIADYHNKCLTVWVVCFYSRSVFLNAILVLCQNARVTHIFHFFISHTSYGRSLSNTLLKNSNDCNLLYERYVNSKHRPICKFFVSQEIV